MRIDAYNQVAQLYGIQKNLKTQKAQNAAYLRDQVSISQAGRDYRRKVQYQKLRISGKIR